MLYSRWKSPICGTYMERYKADYKKGKRITKKEGDEKE
jgi:hypothetical protein